MILSVTVIIGIIIAILATWDACNGFPISDGLMDKLRKHDP